MVAALAQVSFDADTGLPEDRVVNTWHFDADPAVFPATGLADAQNIADMVEDFYTAIPSGAAAAVASLYSSELAGSAIINVYDLTQPTPRVPVLEHPFSFTPGVNALPAEVAFCLSYQAIPVAGISQARRRGRIYLGPFSRSTTVIDGAVSEPDDGMRGIIRRAARDLLAASNASVSNTWAVLSRASTPDALAAVADGWVDNAWDTQRRRGLAPTVRELWSASTPV